jgi:hypothetical protein
MIIAAGTWSTSAGEGMCEGVCGRREGEVCGVGKAGGWTEYKIHVITHAHAKRRFKVE